MMIHSFTVFALCIALAGCAAATPPRARALQTQMSVTVPAQQPNIGTVGAPRR